MPDNTRANTRESRLIIGEVRLLLDDSVETEMSQAKMLFGTNRKVVYYCLGYWVAV